MAAADGLRMEWALQSEIPCAREASGSSFDFRASDFAFGSGLCGLGG